VLEQDTCPLAINTINPEASAAFALHEFSTDCGRILSYSPSCCTLRISFSPGITSALLRPANGDCVGNRRRPSILGGRNWGVWSKIRRRPRKRRISAGDRGRWDWKSLEIWNIGLGSVITGLEQF